MTDQIHNRYGDVGDTIRGNREKYWGRADKTPFMIMFTYNPWLVILSVAISMMSAFTGLSLTRRLTVKSVGQRQGRIIMASLALGGGIWSMHFVAMLAMRFTVPVFYAVIETVASALIAILLSGLALLILHFGRRSRLSILISGTILVLGIVAMHFVGLSAIEGCNPVNKPSAYVLASFLAVAMGIVSIQIAYGKRTELNIVFATLVFGASVAVVHFSAIALTDFSPGSLEVSLTPVLANAQIAIVVLISGFVISGAFLLSGADFISDVPKSESIAVPVGLIKSVPAVPEPQTSAAGPVLGHMPKTVPPGTPADLIRLPYERDGKTMLVGFEKVTAIRAEGHYTTAYLAAGPVFCPLSITQVEDRIPPGFLRVHRSWLVNLAHVSGFERTKDNGWCLFGATTGLDRVPVSRTKVAELRDTLGL